MRIRQVQIITVLFLIVLGGIVVAETSPDAMQLSKVFNKRKKQKCLKGKIDTLTIIRENVEFHLGPGDVKLYDFGAGKPSMMLYKGHGRFSYSPPNSVEQKQLSLLTGLENIKGEFKEAWFLFTIDFDTPIDTSSFKREIIREIEWKKVVRFQNSIVEHLGFNMLIRQLGEIMAGDIGAYFLVKFKLKDIGEMVYCEDPMGVDSRRIYRFAEISGNKSADIIAGYSPDGLLPRQRGYLPIDISHYDIDATIESQGEIKGKCRIEFQPLRGGVQFIYFKWSEKNKVISVEDDKGKPVIWLSRKNEPGFGVWLNEPMQIGQSYSLDVKFKGTPFLLEWDIYFADENKSWYPRNIVYDRATYEIEIIPYSNHGLAHGGNFVPQNLDLPDSGKTRTSKKSIKWIHKDNVDNVLISFGLMWTNPFYPYKNQPLTVYVPGWIHWGIEMPELLTSKGVYKYKVTDFNWFDESANETAKTIILIGRLLNLNYIDTFSVVEVPYTNSWGSEGMICLSSFDDAPNRSRSQFTRAHEVAHQWWGQIVGVDDYRNEWIIEGLAEYFAFITEFDPSESENNQDSILSAWVDTILAANDNMLPLTLGSRLTNSKFDYYNNLAVTKSAYIIHMIRYMLYDFDIRSDRVFYRFIRDLFESHRWKSIFANSLKKTLEKHIGMEMDWFFDQWVYGNAIPEYKFSYATKETEGGKYSVTCNVKQEKVPDSFQMQVPITVLFENDRYIHLKLWINQPEKNIELPLLPYKPKKIIFNTYDAVLCR